MLNLLIKPAWLLVDLIVQDRISHSQYGIYAATFSLSFLFINLADFGLNIYVTRRLSSEPEGAEHLYSTALGFKLAACIFYPLLICGIGYLIGYRGEYLSCLFILGMVQALLQTVYFFRGTLQARQAFRADGISSVLDKIILLAIVLVLLTVGISLQSFIYANLFTALITFMILFFVVIKLQGWIAPKFHSGDIKNLLVKSFPFAMIGLLFAVNDRIDMVMIERLGGEQGRENAGLYAACYRWLDAFMMYLWTVLPVFFARFAAHKEHSEEQQKLFNFGQLLTFIPMVYVGVFVLFYGDKLFWMFTHSNQEELNTMSTIIRIIFIGTIVQGIFTIYGTYLNATGHEKSVSIMIIVSLVLNIVLNWWFIPAYGPVAAAYTTLTSTSLICILYFIRTARRTELRIPYKLLTHLVLLGLCFVLVFYALTLTGLEWYWVSIVAGLFLVGSVYVTNAGGIRTLLKGK